MEPSPDHEVVSTEPARTAMALEWSLTATRVNEAYKLYLQRKASLHEVDYGLQTIRNGLAPANLVGAASIHREL